MADDPIGYRPTIGDSPSPAGSDPASALERTITEGLDESEWLAPTASTIAKMFAKAAPSIGQFVRNEVTMHEYRRDLDDDFWAGLSERMRRPVRELRKKYRDRVSAISVRVLIDPATRQTKSTYMNDPDAAIGAVTEALLQELNQAAADAPSSRTRERDDSRRARPGTRVSQMELDKTVGDVLRGR